jgi:sugar/nucleoside kinase (ribokinase family)
MKLLSGCEDYHEIMNYFRNFKGNSIFIMTLGEQGSLLVKNGEKTLKIPAFKPRRVRDETGAGDVYLAIFLMEYLLSDKSWNAVENSAYIASAAASFLVEEKGTDGVQTKNKIMRRVQRKNYIA